VPWRKKDKAQKSPVKLLVWTAVLGLLFGLVGFGQIAEDWMRTLRNQLHPHKASGEIVLVTIDDASLRQIGRWPWPRRYHAQLVEKLTAAGAKHIYFDVIFDTHSNAVDDAILAKAVGQSGRVTLAVRGEAGPEGAAKQTGLPIKILRPAAAFASIRVDYNYQNAVWRLQRSGPFNRSEVPSLSQALSGGPAHAEADYLVDYSLDYRTIPTINAGDVLTDRFPAASLKGKSVLVGTDTKVIGDQFFLPGVGKIGGAYIHLLGAETLKAGHPISLGWLPVFLLSLVMAIIGAFRTTGTKQNILFGMWLMAMLVAPAPFEAHLIDFDILPGLFVTCVVWGTLAWKRYRSGGVTNAVSGLPNLTALQFFVGGRDRPIVAARILNYADIMASLPTESEKALVEQIVSRLRVGSPDKTVYQGDGGIFAWFEEGRLPYGHHIDALHALFRNPVRIGDLQIDLAVAFGVEIGSGRSLAKRLASALVAADDAAHDGLRWKFHEPEKLQDASWRLSILSQLDQAIDNGEVWIAYQPKLDLRTRKIIGAEALARWTHPEKGPIAATEFIPAAEQNDRIGKLTDFVLDQAISVAAQMNAAGPEFHIAANLSARLLTDRSFPSRLAGMLLKHLLEPELLTLELTETSAITSGDSFETLQALCDLGVQISIDDYGTGLSTLNYLKKVPASEIKIDQSFIRGLLENRSDRVMVQSTIALAHSLNRTVVAEGVESNELLDALVEMNCDVAQGFIIGRPMSIESLRRRLTVEKKRSVG
jgi:EAL domain-containing protein (putative c-di-GMP-specific phosphodiesterase class I)/CHASE2 domain-containing sensor protein